MSSGAYPTVHLTPSPLPNAHEPTGSTLAPTCHPPPAARAHASAAASASSSETRVAWSIWIISCSESPPTSALSEPESSASEPGERRDNFSPSWRRLGKLAASAAAATWACACCLPHAQSPCTAALRGRRFRGARGACALTINSTEHGRADWPATASAPSRNACESRRPPCHSCRSDRRSIGGGEP